MISTAIELHFDCGRCENPVHVNAMTDKVQCSNCDHVTELSWAQWKNVLEDSFDEIPDLAMGCGGRSQSFSSAGPNTDIEYSRFDPYCYACKTEFDAATVARAGVDAVTCGKCGEQWHARAPSEALRKHFPQIRYLFAEDPKLILDVFGHRPKRAAPGGDKPVLFACPGCGGGLKVDGSERMVPCKQCASSVYLPDDLWRRLHPVQTKRRWFIWWDEGERVRDPSRFPDVDETPLTALAPAAFFTELEAEDFEEEEEDDSPTLVSLRDVMKARRNGAPPPGPPPSERSDVFFAAEQPADPAANKSSAAVLMLVAGLVLLLMVAGGVFFTLRVQVDAPGEQQLPAVPALPADPGH